MEIIGNKITPLLLDRLLTEESIETPNQVLIGGYCDPYPRIEKRERITKRLFEVLAQHKSSFILFARSHLILRDIDVIRELDEIAKITIGVRIPVFSQPKLSKIEPGGTMLRRRKELIERLQRDGIFPGIVVFPLIEDLNGTTKELEKIFKWSYDHGIKFVFFPESVDFINRNEEPPSVTSARDLKTAFSNPKKTDRLFRTILELSLKYRIRLLPIRFYPPDVRKENFWIAERLGEYAYYSSLLRKPYREFHSAAKTINFFDGDIRNIIKYGELLDQEWLLDSVKPLMQDMLEGKWILPDYNWDWINELLENA